MPEPQTQSSLGDDIWNWIYPKGWKGGIAGGGNAFMDLIGASDQASKLREQGKNPLEISRDPSQQKAIQDLTGFALGSTPSAKLSPAGGISAFHGTPHTFEPVEHNPFGEFGPLEVHVGTGEGTQVFGHGYYLAENPEVAKAYVGDPAFNLQYDDKMTSLQEKGLSILSDSMKGLRGTVAPVDRLKNIISNYSNTRDNVNSKYWANTDLPDRIEALKSLDSTKIKDTSSLYNVQIKPGEHELLDWDKPFHAQTNEIQNKLTNLALETPLDMNSPLYRNLYKSLSKIEQDEPYREISSGEDIYKALQADHYGNDAATSKILHEVGIPGLKFLDRGSRSAGEGTHNYVIFHPSNLSIIGRNGEMLSLEPIDHDPFSTQPVDHDPFSPESK